MISGLSRKIRDINSSKSNPDSMSTNSYCYNIIRKLHNIDSFFFIFLDI